MKKTLLVTAVALGMAGSAFADVTAQSGVYVAGDLGWSFPTSYSSDSMNDVIGEPGFTTTDQKNHHLGAGAAVGYDYAINQNVLVGAEAGYTYFGKTIYTTTITGTSASNELDDKFSGFQLLATATYLDQSGFNGFAKAGMIDLNENLSDTISGAGSFNASVSDSQHKWLPAVAVGVGYMPIQNLNVALQYERVFGDNSTDATTDTSSKPHSQNLVSLGVSYKFGLPS